MLDSLYQEHTNNGILNINIGDIILEEPSKKFKLRKVCGVNEIFGNYWRVVLEDPFYEHASYEKLRQRKKSWIISDIYDLTLVAPVLTNSGETLIYPLRNLIKQTRKDHE